MMKYSFPSAQSAFHAVDLIPLFTNNQQEVFEIVNNVLVGLLTELLTSLGLKPSWANFLAKIFSKGLADYYAGLLGDEVPEEYRNYFASFALSGNPNEGPSKPPLTWPVADGSQDMLSKVMEVHVDRSKQTTDILRKDKPGFHLIMDDQNAKSTCSFWEKIAQEIMDIQMDNNGGRVPQPLSHIGEL